MSWYLAPSLARLRSQVDRKWPNRSKVSDGTIGDEAHTTRNSDHNPDPKTGVVRALDITTPQTAQGKQIGEAVLKAAWQDPRTFYVIWRRWIYYRGETKPRPYNGVNAHLNHIHVSIDRNKRSAETDTTNWKGLGMAYMSSPMLGRFTSGYNLNRYITLNGKRVFSPHKGIDIAPPVAGTVGTPVHAMFDGTVTKVVTHRKPGQPYNQGSTLHYGYSGNGPRIDNPDGEFQIYVHVKSVVKVGQKVKAGDLIGYTDRSGTQTGPHVHVSTFTASGVEYDPMIVFRKYGVTPGEAPQTTATATAPKEGIVSMKRTANTSHPAAQSAPKGKWRTLDVAPASKNRHISFSPRNTNPALVVARAAISGLGHNDYVEFMLYHLKYDPKKGNGPVNGILRHRIYGAGAQTDQALDSFLDMTRAVGAVPAGHRWRIRARASKPGVTVSNLTISVFQ